MPDENPTLADFGTTDEDENGASTDEDGASTDEDTVAPTDEGQRALDAKTTRDVAPDPTEDAALAVSTADWRPGGATCADCGAAVERRWRDGDALVCVDCKEW